MLAPGTGEAVTLLVLVLKLPVCQAADWKSPGLREFAPCR
jgi:hypothetical protein